jgi:hypothetical protein
MSDNGSTPPPVPPTGGYGTPPPAPPQPPYGGRPSQPPYGGQPPYGQPQGQPPYGPPQNGDFPGRTLGIVGLILSFFTTLVGLIVSAIALSQSKKAGYKNGPALAGVIIGSVLSGLVLIFVVVSIIISVTTSLAVLGVAAGAGGGASDDPFDEPLSTSEPFASPEPTPSESGEPGDGTGTDVFDLVVGDCFDEWSGDTVYEVPVVDCATPHDWEVYSDFEVPDTADGAFPGEDKVDAAADDGCLTAFETFLGASYADTVYDYSYLVPTADSWSESDDRLITCIITDPAGKTTGSLEGAGGGADSTGYSPR